MSEGYLLLYIIDYRGQTQGFEGRSRLSLTANPIKAVSLIDTCSRGNNPNYSNIIEEKMMASMLNYNIINNKR
jgi:hypothetical protein